MKRKKLDGLKVDEDLAKRKKELDHGFKETKNKTQAAEKAVEELKKMGVKVEEKVPESFKKVENQPK